MKLNLGCGFNKVDGYVNVDKFASSQPDIVMDLEVTPWSFKTGEVDEVIFNHSLEHMGQQTETFLRMMQELHRVCRPGATIRIHVPHPRHDSFISDPTHVRIITPELLTLFSKEANRRWKELGVSNSPLGLYLDVDFEVRTVQNVIEDQYLQQLQAGQLREEELNLIVKERNNVVIEYRITLEVIK